MMGMYTKKETKKRNRTDSSKHKENLVHRASGKIEPLIADNG